jgi:hypothetical protein
MLLPFKASVLVFCQPLERFLDMEVVEVLISNDIELYLAIFKDGRETFELEIESNESVFVQSLQTLRCQCNAKLNSVTKKSSDRMSLQL